MTMRDGLALGPVKAGDRVVFSPDPTETGAVREVWPQSNADDLVRVNWDGRKIDPDWYSTAVLEREPAGATPGTKREDA